MSLLTKEKGPKKAPKMSIKSVLLPIYIVLSAIFILYVMYSYFQNLVYNIGFTNGQTQTVQAIIQQANVGCDTFTLTTTDGVNVQLLNVACLQGQTSVEGVVPESTAVSEEEK